MRDPRRIDRILSFIHKKWHEQPDQRLGQLIENITGQGLNWHMEDDTLEAALRAERLEDHLATLVEEYPTWGTADGRKLRVMDMDDDHILNAIGYLFQGNRIPMDVIREAASRKILNQIVREGGLTQVPKLPTYVTLVLDESGSMHSCLFETISGFNEYFETLYGNSAGQTYISNVVKFSSDRGVKPLYQDSSICPRLSNDNYAPSGMTPLLDAIGTAIASADSYISRRPGKFNVLFVIMSDGLENASKEHTKASIKSLIEAREKQGWTFAYLGANQDAFKEAGDMGIQASNAKNYHTTDTQNVFRGMAASTVSYSNRAGGQSVGNFFDAGQS